MIEKALVIPEHQRKHLYPRRGGGVVATPGAVDRGAVERVRAALAEAREKVERLLVRKESAPELVEAGRAHPDGSANPAGAAVLAASVTNIEAGDLADAWVAEHGLAFAAATVGLARLRVEPTGVAGAGVCGWCTTTIPRSCGVRVTRASTTSLPACGHSSPPRMIGSTRTWSRIATAFLAPSETAWVDDVCAELPDSLAPCLARRVMCSLGTADQVERFRRTAQPWDWLVEGYPRAAPLAHHQRAAAHRE